MKALVTGASGFLGRHIIKHLLSRGYEVRAFCRSNHPTFSSLDIEVCLGNLTNHQEVLNACKGVDVVFHTAAKVGSWGAYTDFYQTNVVGTNSIIEACRLYGVKKLIYTSSPSVVFDSKDIRNGDESLPYPAKYMSSYQATKALAEQNILAANNPPNFLTVALRPHAIWGVGDNHLVPRIISMASTKKLNIIGNGKNKISMVHVENAAIAHILAAEKENIGGNAYFINDPEPILLWDWITHLLLRLNLPQPKHRIPFSAALFVGMLSEVIYKTLPFLGEPRVTRYMVSLLSKDHYFDTSKSVKELGYSPIISPEDGIIALVEHYSKIYKV